MVTSVTLVGGGSGYIIAPIISFSTNSGGSGAIATANLTGGVVTSITLNNGGSGYTSVPLIFFDGQSNGHCQRVSDRVRRGAARDTAHPASRDDLIFGDLRGLRI